MMYCRIDTFLPQNIFKIFSEDFYMPTLYGLESCETRNTAPQAKAGGVVPVVVAVILGKDKIFTTCHLCGLCLVTFSDD